LALLLQLFWLDGLVVVLAEHDESLAERDVVLSEKIDESSFSKLTCLSVLNGFLESDYDTGCAIGVDASNIQLLLLVDGRVVRARLSVHFRTLLQVDALDELFEIRLHFRRRLLLDVLEDSELAGGWLSWHISFQRDGSQTAHFLAEAHLALGNS